MNDQTIEYLTRALIEYWHGTPPQDPLARTRCRQLAQRALSQMPAATAGAVPGRPEQHVNAIRATLLALRANDPVARGIMDQLAPPTPPPAQGYTRAPYAEPIVLTLRLIQDSVGSVMLYGSSAATGEWSEVLPLPYQERADDLACVIEALDWLQHPHNRLSGAMMSRLQELGLALPTGFVSKQAHEIVGRRLFHALAQSPLTSRALHSLLNTAIYQDSWLDIRLHVPEKGVALAGLPWELIWGPGNQPIVFSVRNLVTITRHIDIPMAIPPPLSVSGPLRLLAVHAKAGLSEEQRELDRTVRLGVFEPLIQSRQLVMEEIPATLQALVERMQGGPTPDILHIVCHGRYLDGEGYLILDGANGRFERVPASRLGALFQKLRLITLISCQSSMIGGSSLLTGVAPALSAAGAAAVVGMQLTVQAAAAQRFCQLMYRSLVGGEPLQVAVGKARQGLFFEEANSSSWFVPSLTIRTRAPGPFFLR